MYAPFFCRTAAVALSLCCFCDVAANAAPARLTEYIHTAWRPLQGAPAGVSAITQSTDGWLWITSEVGLYRYDGVQFERVESIHGHQLYSSDVVRFMASRDGAMWVAYRTGGISVFRASGVRTFTERDGLPGAVQDIREDADGVVWVAADKGIFRLAPATGRFEAQGIDAGLPNVVVRQMLFARDGTQWLASEEGVFFRRKRERGFVLAYKSTRITGVQEGADGTIWVADADNRYYPMEPAHGHRAPREAPGSAALVGFDRDGYAWVFSHDAVERRRDPRTAAPGLQRLNLDSGTPGARPQAFFQDREGNIWIGTAAGIDRFRRKRIRTLTYGRGFASPHMAIGPKGAVWISDSSGIYGVGEDGACFTVSRDRFTASFRAADGTVWFANERELRRHTPAGTVIRADLPGGRAGRTPASMQQDRKGALWLSFPDGGELFRSKDGRWSRIDGFDGHSDDDMSVMALDAHDTLWIGTRRHSISLVSSEGSRTSVRRLDAQPQLGAVSALYRDGAGMWIGTERGTTLFRDGRSFPLRGVHGETFRDVSGMVRLPDGDLWLHGIEGIYRVSAGSLRNWMRNPRQAVDFERFDVQDGLREHPVRARYSPSMLLGPDGKLWIATRSAIAVVDPGARYRNLVPPAVVIRSVASKNAVYDVEERSSITLPEGVNSLRIGFTALSLSMPERVRFRYRLQGVDRRWQDATERRAIFYANLAPGRYRFELIAGNEDGVWSDKPRVLELDIPPTLTQTAWFRVLAVGAVLMLLYGGYAMRVRALRIRLQRRHEAQLAERSRESRSQDDTLLQGVQGLLLSFGAHATHVPDGSRERAELDQSLRFARQLVVERRDQMDALPAALSPGELVRALERCGKELADYKGSVFEFHVIGVPRMLTPSAHDSLHAMGREALFAVFRRAGVRRVWLLLEYGNDAMSFHVHGDSHGGGSDLASTMWEAGHVQTALQQLRELALQAGADLRVASLPAEGASLTVSLPSGRAYQPRSRAGWKHSLFRWFSARRKRGP